MTIGNDKIVTQYFGKSKSLLKKGPFFASTDEARSQTGSPSVATRNPWDLPLANFTVVAGDNRLSRPIAGGKVESGALRSGTVRHTNVTLNTETKKWQKIGFEQMYITTT